MAINPSHTSEIKIISGVNSSISVVFFIMQFKVPALGTKEQDSKSNHKKVISFQCTEVHFASFLFGGFTTMAVMNPPEKKLKKRTSVHWFGM